MIVFDFFTKANLFEDKELNVFFNQLYTIGCTRFTEDFFLNHFLIGDYVAKAVQSIPSVNDNTISIYARSTDIFEFMKGISTVLNVTDVLILGDQIFFKTPSSKKVSITYTQDTYELYSLANINFIEY
jgi:hypothetical protein